MTGDLKHELEEEGARCLLLAKQRGFNEQCCIRCCGPFSLFLKPRRVCLDCRFNVCKACCSYSQRENGYVCAFCQKSRLLRAQSLDWYYNNVKSRFKRFGSAKVLKTLYRKHIIERGVLSELPGYRVPEETVVRPWRSHRHSLGSFPGQGTNPSHWGCTRQYTSSAGPKLR
ncbi:hypothetical protein PDJAM_G00132920 [Pangasius djambal]|uniref:Uncharacterized protein n=1 Tax=Pangasius djambal TaxID=1691987 RepID=A0ACC5ZC94_9TELE|nr:hypothetical protein [Pangasius djambal]